MEQGSSPSKVGSGGSDDPTESTRPSDTDELSVDSEQVSQWADHLRDYGGAGWTFASLQQALGHRLPPTVFMRLRDDLLMRAGSPSDPVEVFLLEQLLLAHHTVGRLHTQSATSATLEQAKAYGALAIALAGELRRTALAVAAYRESAVRRSATTIDLALPAGSPGELREEEGADSELGGTEGQADEPTIPIVQTASRPRRPAQRQRGQGPHARRA